MLSNELLMLAVIPVVVLLVYIYQKDPVEKEPGKLLAQLLVCGVAVIIPVMLIEGGGIYLLQSWPFDDLSYLVVENFLVVALVEEGCKFLALWWRTWKNPAFDFAFDGIVYAVFVSMGFAVAENIGYVFEYGFNTAIVRAFTAIPGHCVFAVFMGYFYAQAAVASVDGNASKVRTNMFLAILIPFLCHGTYDVLASIFDETMLIVFFVFLIVMVAIGIGLVRNESRKARRLVAPAMPVEASQPVEPSRPIDPSWTTEFSQTVEPSRPADPTWPAELSQPVDSSRPSDDM